MTAPGRLLGGRYELGELLGYGGMAEVHLGRDLRLGRDVAIKMLRTDLARDHTFQMRFRREAQNAATLNHPGIAAVYDTGEEQGAGGESLPYIVMEFVSGHTLKDVLAAEQRLQPRRALEIAADICAALEFSHRHGIIHRDVKPGNVMLNSNAQVKVMDFGIARDLASGATTMTQTSAVIGTAQYLSPEQARGEAVDARSDVYATGCVLFELLCGHPPFVGDSPVSVAYQHVREDPRAPSELNPEVAPDVDAVVLKALAKNPANRYQSAAEMRADLLRAASGRPVLATPVLSAAQTAMLGQAGGEPARVGDPERRRASTWVLIALAVLGVLAVIALIAGLILTNQSAEQVDTPGVVGLSEDEAIEAIGAVGLQAQAGAPVAEGCAQEEGQVEAQSPAPGDPAEVDSVVTYQLCTAEPTVTIPANLVGANEDFAVQQLESLDLEVVVEPVESPESSGTVLTVSPDQGTEVEVGSTVTLEVSAGGIETVPDVIDRSAAEARGALEQAGFQVDEQESSQSPSDPDQVGRVESQDPASGEERPVNSTVTIFVYPEGAPLQVDEPVQLGGGEVQISWDNDIYGAVAIDWGDGGGPENHADPSGTAPHTYTVEEPTEFTITVTSVDHPERTQTVTVTIEP